MKPSVAVSTVANGSHHRSSRQRCPTMIHRCISRKTTAQRHPMQGRRSRRGSAPLVFGSSQSRWLLHHSLHHRSRPRRRSTVESTSTIILAQNRNIDQSEVHHVRTLIFEAVQYHRRYLRPRTRTLSGNACMQPYAAARFRICKTRRSSFRCFASILYFLFSMVWKSEEFMVYARARVALPHSAYASNSLAYLHVGAVIDSCACAWGLMNTPWEQR